MAEIQQWTYSEGDVKGLVASEFCIMRQIPWSDWQRLAIGVILSQDGSWPSDDYGPIIGLIGIGLRKGNAGKVQTDSAAVYVGADILNFDGYRSSYWPSDSTSSSSKAMLQYEVLNGARTIIALNTNSSLLRFESLGLASRTIGLIELDRVNNKIGQVYSQNESSLSGLKLPDEKLFEALSAGDMDSAASVVGLSASTFNWDSLNSFITTNGPLPYVFLQWLASWNLRVHAFGVAKWA